ncbi:MAG: response regulator [Treponema sp.]|jgi:CheY-like chemotaxis protein|nr:response regulator [Treponema sp.]
MTDIKTIKTILVVDDMPVNLMTIKNIIRSNNEYELCSTKTGQEALIVLSRNIIDLMLLDIEMPKMDGFQLFEKVKENKFYDGVPVVFVTGTATPDVIDKALKMGARDYIVKPIYANILLKKIHAIFYPYEGEVDPILDVLIRRLGLVDEACKVADINEAERLITAIQPEKYSEVISLTLNRVRTMLHNHDNTQATKMLKGLRESLTKNNTRY